MADARAIAMFTYATQPRGGVLHALALAEALQRIGNAVTLFAVDRPGAAFPREPRCAAHVVEVEPRRESLFDFVRRRRAAIEATIQTWRERFDVYHTHDGIGASAMRALAARGTIDAYVRTVHHLSSHGDERVDAIERDSIAGARRVFVVSDRSRRELLATYAIAAPVVGNGVDRSRFFPRMVPPKPEPGRPHFFTIGGIEERKNSLVLLDAFARVKRRIPGARLTIAGGASVLDHAGYRNAFDARLRALDLATQSDVVILGPVDDDDIVERLRSADAFVFPSLVEGFGLVVLEALACGTPVVVSNVPPFVDYLASDDAIFVSPHAPEAVANGMLAALDPKAARRLRARGPHVAGTFTWSAVARACLRGYDA